MQLYDMGMNDPLPTVTTLIERVQDSDAHSKLALIHVRCRATH